MRRVPTERLNGCSSGYINASRSSLASESTVVPPRFHAPFGLEAQVADDGGPTARGPADGAEVRAVGVFLIEPADDVGRDRG